MFHDLCRDRVYEKILLDPKSFSCPWVDRNRGRATGRGNESAWEAALIFVCTIAVMFATLVRCSKASRKPLTPKRGNKDYYKGVISSDSLPLVVKLTSSTGTRQAFLPGGHRTGAPGKHVIGGKAKYRLVDEKVRVFVAPPLSEILSTPASSVVLSWTRILIITDLDDFSQLKPYVARNVHLTKSEKRGVLGKLPPGGLQGAQLLELSRAKAIQSATGETMAHSPTS